MAEHTPIHTGELELHGEPIRTDDLSPQKRELLNLLLTQGRSMGHRAARPYIPPRTPQEELLARVWQDVLGLSSIGVEDDFFELGGDSIQCIQIMARSRQLGLSFSAEQLFNHPTVGGLAVVAQQTAASLGGSAAQIESARLAPIQKWFFELPLRNRNHWNQSVVLETPSGIRPDLLDRAVRIVVDRHGALRLRFWRREEEWFQEENTNETASCFSHYNLSADNAASREAIVNEMQRSLNLAEGPLIRCALLDFNGQRPSQFILICHHLAVDGISFRILLGDLIQIYEALSQGHDPAPSDRTDSFLLWAEACNRQGNTPVLDKDVEFWERIGTKPAPLLPIDYPDGKNTEGSASQQTIECDEEETHALVKLAAAPFRFGLEEILLAAVANALADWNGSGGVRLDVERHGREQAIYAGDVSRTSGWFTSLFPFYVDLAGARDVMESARAVKNELARLPYRGASFGLSRYCGSPQTMARLAALPKRDVMFNYLGRLDPDAAASAVPWSLSNEDAGPDYDPDSERPHALQIVAAVAQKKLRVTLIFSTTLHREQTIVQFAHSLKKHLQQLAEAATSGDPARWTAREFPDANLSGNDFDTLLSQHS